MSETQTEQTRKQLVEAFVPHSPHAAALGISIESIEDDRAVLAMPFKPELATMGDVVHGGAISTLIDTAATVAAWAIDEVPESPAGATVSLSVNFTAAARAVDLRAEAQVVRRGRQLSNVEIRAPTPTARSSRTGSRRTNSVDRAAPCTGPPANFDKNPRPRIKRRGGRLGTA